MVISDSFTWTPQIKHETLPKSVSLAHLCALHSDYRCEVLAATVLWWSQVGNNGGIEGLVVDTAGRYISSTYARRISLHEAGHFLIAYLIGLLPKMYTLSTLDAVQRCVFNDAIDAAELSMQLSLYCQLAVMSICPLQPSCR